MKEKYNFDYKVLHPFKWYILENFPFLEDSIDALTNYQLFCKLGEMYNKQVDAINMLGVQVETLTDWFDNLDVQEEINNKLDDMAKSGELEEIIASYLNTKAVLGYDTLTDLKEAENIVSGAYAQTLGYYAKDDGGKGLYKIREITNQDVVDEMKIIALADNNLIAELIEDGIINAKQIGCKTDGSDNATIINNYFEKYDQGLYFPDGIYIVNNEIDTIGNIIMSDKAWLKAGSALDCVVHINKNLVIPSGSFANYYPKNQEIKINVDGNKKALTGIRTDKLHWAKLTLTVKDCQTYGVYTRYNTSLGHAENTFDIQVMYDSDDGENTSTGLYLNGSDDIYNNIVSINTKYCCEIHGSDNSINTIHGWLVNSSLWTGSILLKISNNKNHISNLIVDTYETGITLTTDFNLSTGVFNYTIDFMFGMINETFIDDATLRANYKLWDFTGLTGTAKNNSSLLINSYIGNSKDTSKISLGADGLCPFNTKLIYGDDFTTPKWPYSLDYCPEGTFGFNGDTAVSGRPTYVTAGQFILSTKNGSLGKVQELINVGTTRTTGTTTYNMETGQPSSNFLYFYKRVLSKFNSGNSAWGQYASYFIQEPTT